MCLRVPVNTTHPVSECDYKIVKVKMLHFLGGHAHVKHYISIQSIQYDKNTTVWSAHGVL